MHKSNYLRRLAAGLAVTGVIAAGSVAAAVSVVDDTGANGLKATKANSLKVPTSHNALRRGPENEI